MRDSEPFACLWSLTFTRHVTEHAPVPTRATKGPRRATIGGRRSREWVMASVPAALKQQVDRWAATWITAKFSRLLELRALDPGPFNYPIAVFSEWRGKSFYLNARFRARSRRVEDDFVVRHARMTLTGFGRFDLAYFRHTGREDSMSPALATTRRTRSERSASFAPGLQSGRHYSASGEAI